MNDFEGINTGHWLVNYLDFNMHDAQCSFCGYHMQVSVHLDIRTFKPELRGLREHCPKCNKNMFQSELELNTTETDFTINTTDPNSNSIVISCERIILAQKSIGIELDISKNMETIEVIEINGIKFRRETI